MSTTYKAKPQTRGSKALEVNKDGIVLGTIVGDRKGKYFIPFETIYRNQPGLTDEDLKAIARGMSGFDELYKNNNNG